MTQEPKPSEASRTETMDNISERKAAVRGERLPVLTKRLDTFFNEPIITSESASGEKKPDASGEPAVPPSGEVPIAGEDTHIRTIMPDATMPDADPEASKIKDDQIKSLMATYGDNPECKTVLAELESLLGTNPDEGVIQSKRAELLALADKEPDVVETVASIDRGIGDENTRPAETVSATPPAPGSAAEASAGASPVTGAPVTSSGDAPVVEKKETEIWDKGRLLREIPDGGTCVLTDTKGNEVEYRRVGDKFLKGNNKKDRLLYILKERKHGSKVSLKQEATIPTASEPTLAPAAESKLVPGSKADTPLDTDDPAKTNVPQTKKAVAGLGGKKDVPQDAVELNDTEEIKEFTNGTSVTISNGDVVINREDGSSEMLSGITRAKLKQILETEEAKVIASSRSSRKRRAAQTPTPKPADKPVVSATPPTVDAPAPAPAVAAPIAPAGTPAPLDSSTRTGVADTKIAPKPETVKLPEEGERLYYATTSGKKVVERFDGRYYVFDEEDESPLGVFLNDPSTAEDIARMAEEQGWKLIDAPVMPDATIDTKMQWMLPTAIGDKVYFTGNGSDGTVEKVATGYRIHYQSPPGFIGAVSGTLTAADVLALAKKEGWLPVEKLTRPDVVSGYTEPDFSALKTGEQVVYRGNKGRVRLTVLGAGTYKLENASGDMMRLDNDRSKERLQALAKEEQWVPDTVPTLEDEIEPVASKKEEMRGFEPLKDGERARYVVPGTHEVIMVEREEETYIVSRGTDFIPYTEADIISLAQAEKWQLYAEGLKPEDFEMKKDTPEEPKPVKESEDEKKIKDLRDLMEVMRLEYVSADYNEKSKWPWLKRVLGKGIGDQPNSQATEEAYKRYHLALTNLKDAQLALVKKENLSGAAFQERMGGMLHFYERQAGIELAATRNDVKIESRNWPQRLVSAAEDVGRRYNQMSRKKKLLIGASLAGVGIATGAVGGAVAAGGILFGRRLLTTAGLAVTFDTLLEGRQEKKDAKRFETEKEKQLEALGKITERDKIYEALDTLLKNKIDDMDLRFEAYKKRDEKRRILAWGGGGTVAFVGGTAVSGFMREVLPHVPGYDAAMRTMAQWGDGVREYLDLPARDTPLDDEIKKLDNKKQLLNKTETSAPAPAASAAASAPGASAPSQAFLDARYPSSYPPGTPEVGQATPAPSPESVRVISALREDYTVTAADGKRGLWGVLDRRLPGNIPEGSDRNRMIASLENIMRTMTPEQLKEAGFRTGDINKIYPGDKINFNKLWTPEQIQSILDGKSVGAPSVADVIERPSGSAGGRSFVSPIDESAIDRGDAYTQSATPMDQAVFNDKVTRLANQPMVPLDQWVARPDPTRIVQDAIDEDRANTPARESVQPVSAPVAEAADGPRSLRTVDLMAYLRENPDAVISYEHALKEVQTAIFSLSDYERGTSAPVMVYDDGGYQIGTHGGVFMGRVFEASNDIRTGKISPFDYDRGGYPLKASQVERLMYLVKAASHPNMFGPVGRVLEGETVDAYLNRIAAIATVSGPHKQFILTGLLNKKAGIST